MIKNEMELLVEGEVRRLHGKRAKGSEPCRCPLCEADIAALALNQLPPRYCHGNSYGQAKLQAYGEKVRAAVTRAFEKVRQRPKHRPGKPDHGTDARVLNYAKEIGANIVGPLLAQRSSACGCALCRADTLALALNRYPPKYGVSAAGRESYQANFEDFIHHEMALALEQAAVVVEAHPHH